MCSLHENFCAIHSILFHKSSISKHLIRIPSITMCSCYTGMSFCILLILVAWITMHPFILLECEEKLAFQRTFSCLFRRGIPASSPSGPGTCAYHNVTPAGSPLKFRARNIRNHVNEPPPLRSSFDMVRPPVPSEHAHPFISSLRGRRGGKVGGARSYVRVYCVTDRASSLWGVEDFKSKDTFYTIIFYFY